MRAAEHVLAPRPAEIERVAQLAHRVRAVVEHDREIGVNETRLARQARPGVSGEHLKCVRLIAIEGTGR